MHRACEWVEYEGWVCRPLLCRHRLGNAHLEERFWHLKIFSVLICTSFFIANVVYRRMLQLPCSTLAPAPHGKVTVDAMRPCIAMYRRLQMLQ
ncbi:hypothetical protein BT96DRAFT_437658 [Gymnopus androsaceus JB14]|uniref:Uncharacterized protein n=1 Tax=Gymnopus androsaceus JB14 TaxID=1447944 RepID=A0A6A4GTA4_9AGAR|nr:hypothetical protein BT96DRAFT_437658 [Gymnopus androsaceus JB14]